MLTPQQQLTATAKQIKQWQQTKEYRNSSVPEPLRLQVLVLFEHFTVHELKQTIKLSESLLHRWSKLAKSAVKNPVATTQPPEFVNLPMPETSPSNHLSLELSVGELCQIRLTGDISVQQLDVFTRNIFMYQAGVNP
ncbi:MAG: hypothetical protein ACI8WB_005688 [Phenylobacterium sp.]|jgi:hypothetical protein